MECQQITAHNTKVQTKERVNMTVTRKANAQMTLIQNAKMTFCVNLT